MEQTKCNELPPLKELRWRYRILDAESKEEPVGSITPLQKAKAEARVRNRWHNPRVGFLDPDLSGTCDCCHSDRRQRIERMNRIIASV